MKREQNFFKNKLAITVEKISYTEEKIVVQSDIKNIDKTMKMLVVELHQQKYKEYKFPDSSSLAKR